MGYCNYAFMPRYSPSQPPSHPQLHWVPGCENRHQQSEWENGENHCVYPCCSGVGLYGLLQSFESLESMAGECHRLGFG